MSSSGAVVEDVKVPLLEDLASTVRSNDGQDHDHQDQTLARKVWIESKNLWHIDIVSPAALSPPTPCWSSPKPLLVTLGDFELAEIHIFHKHVKSSQVFILASFSFLSHLAACPLVAGR